MFVQVLLPLKLEWIPWYSSEVALTPGTRVNVQLAGRNYVGVVWTAGCNPDVPADRIQPIDGVAEGLSEVSGQEMRFWEFLSSYYLCTLGDVYKAAYPMSRIKSELTLVAVHRRHEQSLARLAAKRKKKPAPQSVTEDSTPENPLYSPLPTRPQKPVLLVSDSRTEYYKSRIREYLDAGKDVLMLIPEIAISDRLRQSLESGFGGRIGIYNSTLTPKQRRDISETLLKASSPMIVLGTRCSLFLPFRNLGLVIVDEEQDRSFKQSEPNPRLNARDAAVVLANIHGAEIILGSATPSIESLYNCRIGKYLLLGSFCHIRVPLIDISEERKKRGMNGPFSFKLIKAIRQAGENLTIIRGWEKTEELETKSAQLFPEKKVRIMTAHEALNASETDILAADCVAVLQADALFDRNDFRADEKAHQLLVRLCITFRCRNLTIQTANVSHPVFKAVTGEPDLDGMLEERKLFRLPPFSKLIDINIEDSSPKRLLYMASCLASDIFSASAERASTTFTEGAASLRIALPRQNLESRKKAIARAVSEFEKRRRYYGHIVLDVDPF